MSISDPPFNTEQIWLKCHVLTNVTARTGDNPWALPNHQSKKIDSCFLTVLKIKLFYAHTTIKWLLAGALVSSGHISSSSCFFSLDNRAAA